MSAQALEVAKTSPTSRSTPVLKAQTPYKPPVPPNLGAPKGRVLGGASRGICSHYQSMQALLPSGDRKTPWAFTALAHPTLWFYLPEQKLENTKLEFVLQDPADQYIYKTVLASSKPTGGVISLSLPANGPALIPGLMYTWTLSIPCNPSRPGQVAFVQGTLVRAAWPSIASSEAGSDSLTTTQALAEKGFWFDAVTLAAKGYQHQPTNSALANLWQSLLGKTGVAKLDLLPPTTGYYANNTQTVLTTEATALSP
ncbi:MAG TPA: DUF928 domain-containing protein [Stenomitos sp.]